MMLFAPRAWRRVVLALLGLLVAAAGGAAGEPLHPQFNVGPWIWAPVTRDKQTVRLWRAVEIPARPPILKAHLRITADNSYRLFLDGRELGRGTEWKSLTHYDLTWVLEPGAHVLAVEAFNDYLQAGVTVGLRVVFADESTWELGSDERWKVVPEDERGWMTRKTPRPHWAAAQVVTPYLTGVWKSNPARIIREAPVQPVAERFWQTGWFQVGLIALCVGVAAWCVYLLSRLALQATAQEVLQRERARIARDIHDDFGARLTKLVLVGEVAQSEVGGSSPLRARFEHVASESRKLLGALDEVVWTVNSRRDTVRDFETYVCNYAETFLRATPIRLRMDADSELPEAAFDLPTRRNLFLAVKEALNNAVKHAGATEVQLAIHVRGGNVEVTIADDGRGFDRSAVDPERNGLSNMEQRTHEVGGTCRITSRPGAGCRVELIAPLRVRRRAFLRRFPWSA